MLGDVESLQGFLDRAWEEALALGLSPHPVEFEVVPSAAIFELASYGMPGHWSHWTYGRDYWQFKQRMESGHGRLYEMVVNTNPAHAYLLESNTVAAQKLVVAHVLGHSDVFANHERFRDTPKDMDRSMAAARERFSEYEAEFGPDRVERLLDGALSLSAQVAPDRPGPGEAAAPAGGGRYRDLFGDGSIPLPSHRRRAPYPLPTYDLLGFLARYSPVLEEWERDVLEAVRREALYFEPQRMTKLVNEGYATLVHNTLLSRLPVADDEALEAARVHAQVIAPFELGINPYRVGFQLLSYLVEQYGFARTREIVMLETDSSLLRNWLSREAVERLDLYQYRWQRAEHRLGNQMVPTWDAVVTGAGWEAVRDDLANRYAYRGPQIVAERVDGRGRLILQQVEDGMALDEPWAQATLDQVQRLWGAPVLLERPGGPALESRLKEDDADDT